MCIRDRHTISDDRPLPTRPVNRGGTAGALPEPRTAPSVQRLAYAMLSGRGNPAKKLQNAG
eukprot:3722018-Alexandrium_andersonii.AAC.1